MERTMLVRDAVDYLKISRQAVHQAVKRGDITIAGTDRGGWLLLDKSSVQAFHKDRRAQERKAAK